jgi:hypothetical protein
MSRFAVSLLIVCVAIHTDGRIVWSAEKPLDAAGFIARAKEPPKEPRSRSTVRQSLRWLARHQHPDGGWSFASATAGFAKPGTAPSRVEATSLAMLTLLGSGNTHQKGRDDLHLATEKGLAFLGRQMKLDGKAVDARGPHGDINAHAFSTLVLCQLYLNSEDADLKAVSAGCVQFLLQQQDPKTGGWPRKPGERPTLATHVWTVLALQCGQWAKLADADKAREHAEAFLAAQRFQGGAYYADAKGKKSALATAQALVCQAALGKLVKGQLGVAGVEYLAGKDRPQHDAEYDFLVTLLLFHQSSDAWRKWNELQLKQVIGSQQKTGLQSGSWYDVQERQAKQRGQLYQTTMRVLCLEVYYRWMPIHGFRFKKWD